MSCFHPCVLQATGKKTSSGKNAYKFLGPLEKLYPDKSKNYSASIRDLVLNSSDYVLIPCNKCSGCRIDYSRGWADRMLLEMDYSKKAIFLTLTYNDRSLHKSVCSDDYHCYYTLDKRDVTLFIKRLRYFFPDKEIRYYYSGEYGSTTDRPHYHFILYGFSVDDFSDKVNCGTNKFGAQYWSSDFLADIWSKGFVRFSDVSWRTMAYVSRYVTKKQNKDDPFYREQFGQVPEFNESSRRPGIGMHYLLDHPEDAFKQSISVLDGTEVREVRFPSKLLEKFTLVYPENYDKLKETRSQAARSALIMELDKTDLDAITYFHNKEVKFLERTKVLVRNQV